MRVATLPSLVGFAGVGYGAAAGRSLQTALDKVGNNGSPAELFPLAACQGDCDTDDECGTGLFCFQRAAYESVPGCTGAGESSVDYCFARPPDFLWSTGNNGVPAEAFPLSSCDGDCDVDGDCADGLACFMRDAFEDVPGCWGAGKSGHDYCIDATLVTPAPVTPFPSRSPLPPTLDIPRPLEKVGNNGSPPEWFPLDACRGDCDNDNECMDHLFCFQRSGNEPVPGCTGNDESSTDYCFHRPLDYLWNTGNNGLPAEAFPLGTCEGDCDHDDECEGNLICFSRAAPEDPVPGCQGTGKGWAQYCIDPAWTPKPTPAPSTSPTTPFPSASPTRRPTRSPLPPTLDASRPLELVDGSSWPWPLDACMGDCNNDDECMDDLLCFQRSSNEPIPGCVGEGTSAKDYCFERPANYLWYLGNNGVPADAFPLSECSGDCDEDIDCVGDLKCYKFGGDVPGCEGTRGNWQHYCFNRAADFLHKVGNNGSPVEAFPLKNCEGDCDNDSECADGLKCFQRDGHEEVPGCYGHEEGSSYSGTDYCFDPSNSEAPTASPSLSLTPTANPTAAPTTAAPTTADPTLAPTLNTVKNIFDLESHVAAFGCTNPATHEWPRAFDGNTEKFFCDRTGQVEDAGIIVLPSQNLFSVAQSLRVYSHNDCSGCDPVSFILEGRTDSAGAWTLIQQGDLQWLNETPGRNARGQDIDSSYESADANLVVTEVALTNTVEFLQYKLTFPSTRDPSSNSLQFGEVELVGVLYDSSSMAINSPTPFVQSIVCPPVGSTKALVPGYKIASPSPADTFCGIFIRKESGDLIPYARSYNTHAWEASPGPLAISSEAISCFVECIFTLPDLGDISDAYVILAKASTDFASSGETARRLFTSQTKDIARFLEMTTFGAKAEEIEALDIGAWDAAQYVRSQMDLPATSHREYYRQRLNVKWDATTQSAISDHPCSPNSKWRRYSFIQEDRFRTISGQETELTFETVAEEAGLTTTIYELDRVEDVSAHGTGSFEDSGTIAWVHGYSGTGFYDMAGLGDFLEVNVDVTAAGTYPISFRYANGSTQYNFNRPCQLFVNGVMARAVYDFKFTDGSSYWRYSDLVDVSLNAGQNTIKLLVADQNGGPWLDHVRIGKPPAVVMKLEGWPRAVAKNGIHLLDDFGFDFTDATPALDFDDYPQPPMGDMKMRPYGRLKVNLPDGRIRMLDTGNLPVDFGGYEHVLEELPNDYFTFDGTETWVETASDLFDYPIRRDQELLLVNGMDNPNCDLVPPFSSESDAPILGRLVDGSWLIWTPRIQLESNGPSISDDPATATSKVLVDGGGESSAKTGEKLKCANVARTTFNEETCFLSSNPNTCPSTEAPGISNGFTVVCGSQGEISNDLSLPETFAAESEESEVASSDELSNQKSVIWYETALHGLDQLRQRMAWALAQIVTTVPSNINARARTEVHVSFYDIFVRHAFGNYRDILKEASYNPLMAEHLSYLGSKSHPYVYYDEDMKVSRADENYAREIMQLFSIGLVHLNDDGTPVLDPETGSPLETYTNLDVESYARAWTGFDRVLPRGNYEEDQRSSNRLDPMKIDARWRDPFPKTDLAGGFIGDRYVLCTDLPTKAFLAKGAKYRLLGGSPLPQLMADPDEFADATYNVSRVELSSSSPLYQHLHNGGNFELGVTLENDLACTPGTIECDVETVRVVKVGPVYFEFVPPPCVQLGFYDNGKQISLRDNSRYGTMCANADLAHAREACCRENIHTEVRSAIIETDVTYFYEGERMPYSTAQDRCVLYGKDLCHFERVTVEPSDDYWRKGYHWTNKDCAINIKVNREGSIAIVHDAKSTYDMDNIPYHVEETNTLNWFRVFWENGIYPGDSETNSCAANNCKMLDDGDCLCKTKVTESAPFSDLTDISKEAVVSQLFLGALGPKEGSTAMDLGGGVIAHLIGGVVDGNSVFEIEEKGKSFYLKNSLSTVSLEGWKSLPPQIYEAEDATVYNATIETSTSSLATYVDFDGDTSGYIEWNIDVPADGTYYASLRYGLDTYPQPLATIVNGVPILREASNPTVPIINTGWNPDNEMTRCEGDCDSDDQCAEGLVCMQNSASEPVPGCTGSQNNGWDYCFDSGDHVHPLFLPTGGTKNDWHYSAPLAINLTAGSNTIRVKMPDGYTRGPNVDHMRIEGIPVASEASFRNPPHFMSLIPDYYRQGAKELGEQTVRDAQYETEAVLDSYFYHANVAPFLCTRIMQRFSVSNPSPRFVASCAHAFRTGLYTSGGTEFGSGEYGSLEAMVAAILLDAEATDLAVAQDPSSGSVREPLLKVMNLLRSMKYETHIPTTLDGPPMQTTYTTKLWEIHENIGMAPYQFPSVFSWYLPEYITDSGPTHVSRLVSPESQLLSMPNVVNLINGMFSLIKYGLSDCNYGWARFPGYGDCNDDGLYERSIGHLTYVPAGADLTEKCHELSLLLTAGRMPDDDVATIVAACSEEPDEASQIRCMQQLIVTTGEFNTNSIVAHSDTGRATETVVGESNEPYKAVVYLYLHGGMDGFNLLAPHTCAPVDVYERYREIRGKSGLSEGIGMPLSRLLEIYANDSSQPCSSFGIHENLPVLKEMYDAGDLNFIANAGLLSEPLDVHSYKDVEWRSKLYSHNGMELETKKEDLFDAFSGTGVGGRMADVLSQNGIPTNVFSVNGQTAAIVGDSGNHPQFILNSKGVSPFNPDPSIENMENAIRALNNGTKVESGFFAETYSSKLVDILDKQALLQAALDATSLTTLFPEDSRTADQFALVARLMQTAETRGSRRDIFYIASGGFDTHSNIDANLIEKFTSVNAALDSFVKEMKHLNLWGSVVLVEQSEFGRTLAPNSGGGSDHGWGSNFFMLGGAVKGGKILGKYPSEFVEGDAAGIMLSRGRMVPTTPWDAVWKATAEWFGIPANGPEMDKVLPMHKNFPSEMIYDKEELFDVFGMNGEQSTS